MVRTSPDGFIEVKVSEIRDLEKKFGVAIRQLVPGNLSVWINFVFGPENSTRYEYKTQDPIHETSVRGSHGEQLIDVEFSPTQSL